jgi:dUTP pyrophosphatase
MDSQELFVKLLSEKSSIPCFATAESAGMDLVSTSSVVLSGGDTRMFGTGVCVKLPPGTVGLVCSRSGMAAKNSVFVLNSPGVIDADYRGEVCVILHNAGRMKYSVRAGDRIAQLLVMPIIRPWIRPVKELDETGRGEGGFGSTGE